MLRNFLIELETRNKALYWFGWVNMAALIVAFILSFADHTIVTGINAWIKPMKFSLSILIYSWTFAWLLFYLPDVKKRNFITWGIILCMVVENGLIYMQAARGMRSHFNVTTSLDGMIFTTMGIFIMINSILNVYTLILFFSNKINLETPLLWAWRSGLVLFILGGISGGIMAAVLHHTIGGPDDGPGLPFFNWSTLFGDIRAAHFITLHGLQAIPIAAWVFMKLSRENAKSFVLFFSLAYLAFCLWLHWIALNGVPFISI